MDTKRIEIFRGIIDDLDESIIHMIDNRYRAVLRIAKIKRESDVEIHDPGREEAIRKNAVRNSSAMPPELASQVIQSIVETIRNYNENSVSESHVGT